jgi:predicted protein tyrosine phosphatase
MKILCCCSEGANRSVTLAHILRYAPDFETMTVGLKYNSDATVMMMFEWADKILLVERWMITLVPKRYEHKVKIVDIGPDIYPRPYNPELYAKIKRLLEKDRIA